MQTGTIATIGVLAAFALGWELGHSGSSIDPISDAGAAGGLVRGPNEIAPDRYVYYPGTAVRAICSGLLTRQESSHSMTRFTIDARIVHNELGHCENYRVELV